MNIVRKLPYRTAFTVSSKSIRCRYEQKYKTVKKRSIQNSISVNSRWMFCLFNQLLHFYFPVVGHVCKDWGLMICFTVSVLFSQSRMLLGHLMLPNGEITPIVIITIAICIIMRFLAFENETTKYGI